MTTTATYTRCPRCGGSVYTYFDLDLREHILCCFHCGRDSGYRAPAEDLTPTPVRRRIERADTAHVCEWCGATHYLRSHRAATRRFCSPACSLQGRGKPARVEASS